MQTVSSTFFDPSRDLLSWRVVSMISGYRAPRHLIRLVRLKYPKLLLLPMPYPMPKTYRHHHWQREWNWRTRIPRRGPGSKSIGAHCRWRPSRDRLGTAREAAMARRAASHPDHCSPPRRCGWSGRSPNGKVGLGDGLGGRRSGGIRPLAGGTPAKPQPWRADVLTNRRRHEWPLAHKWRA